MGEDRALPDPAGLVVHIEVVPCLREEAPNFVDLARILGQVRLPVRAVVLGKGRGFPQQLGACSSRRSAA